MSLISIAIYDTPENGRSELTRRTLESLLETVDFQRHRVFLVVNAATDETENDIKHFFNCLDKSCTIIRNAENVGTARAINQAWKYRKPGEHAIKMDNDVVIHRAGWVDEMEEAITRDARIGIIGLKRKDLWETPWHPSPDFRSTLRMLPHEAGQRWIIVEDVQHVMGTCQMYSSALLDKIGYLYQPGPYGFDDSLSAIRCRVSGFRSCFLHGYEIDHIDPGGNDHTKWKSDITASGTPANKEYHRLKDGYLSGAIPVYYDADGAQPVEHALPFRSWLVPNLSTR
jgi:GT2 family glycosyltransferase